MDNQEVEQFAAKITGYLFVASLCIAFIFGMGIPELRLKIAFYVTGFSLIFFIGVIGKIIKATFSPPPEILKKKNLLRRGNSLKWGFF